MSTNVTEIWKNWTSESPARIPVLIIIFLGLAAYANSFFTPFFFDDYPSIVHNPSIRRLTLPDVLAAPKGFTPMAGRPVVNVSLAVNYHISGFQTWSYHFLNLSVHILAGLALFGIIRRTFQSRRLAMTFGEHATPLAFLCALMWLLHPIQPQAVTYIVQRCESMMGMFFLLTLYFAIRGWGSLSPRPWHLLAILSFFCGIGSKEVIVAAPFLILIYDRTFVNDSLLHAFRHSRELYTGLGFGLLLIGVLVMAGGTASTINYDQALKPIPYLLVQSKAILHYLRLSFWPDQLSIDYSKTFLSPDGAFPYVAILSFLGALTIWGVVKRHPAGFLGAWFFLILAPTSSILPLPDPVFEHRMYLPLAAPVVGTTAIGYLGVRFWARHQPNRSHIIFATGFALTLIVALSLGFQTYLRNGDYRSKVSIWLDTTRKQPENVRAHHSLGDALIEIGRYSEAEAEFRQALALLPTDGHSMRGIGRVLAHQGRIDEGIIWMTRAVEVQPYLGLGHNSLGIAMLVVGRYTEAAEHFRASINLGAPHAQAENNIGVALERQGREEEAMMQYRRSIAVDPDFELARKNLHRLERKAAPENKD